jgi:hypothetical protein
MKKYYLIFVSILFAFATNCNFSQNQKAEEVDNIGYNLGLDSLLTPISEVEYAFANKLSDINVTVKGTVYRILSDDLEGDKHQRFIIEMKNGQTLLIVHNIDLAPRVYGIKVNAVVFVRGDYIWNDDGGLIHWTHLDPQGVHDNGWIYFNGTRYE